MIKASIGDSLSHSPNAAVSWLKALLLVSEGEGRVVRGGGVDLSLHRLQHMKSVASVSSQSICCMARHWEFKNQYLHSTASRQTTDVLPVCTSTAGFALGEISSNFKVCVIRNEN